MARPSGARGAAPCRALRTSDDNVHIAVASSDTSTTDPSPVWARRNSAAAMPKASAMPPFRSPMAPRCEIG